MNELFEQTRIRFGAMPASTRLLSGLLLVVVVVSTIWMLAIYDNQAKLYILGALAPGEMQLVTNTLDAAGLHDYEVAANGTRIRVPHNQKAEYVQALQSGGALPSTWGEIHQDAFTGGLFESALAQERRHEMIKERAFEATLKMRPQIDNACVEFDQAESIGLENPTCTCCIQVQRTGNRPIEHSVLQNIRLAATKYFAGLELDNVMVIDLSTSQSNQADYVPVVDDRILLAKNSWEEFYQTKIRHLLDQYEPVEILVEVDIDPTLSHETETLNLEPTVAEKVSISRRVEMAKPKHVLTIDAPETEAAPLEDSSKEETLEEYTTETNQFGREGSLKKVAGLQPKSVRITVGLPESHYRKIFSQQQRLGQTATLEQLSEQPTAEQLTQIRSQVEATVQSALKAVLGSSSAPALNTSFHVYSYVDLPPDETPPLDFAQVALIWLAQYWQTATLIVLALLALLMANSWMKGSKSPHKPQLAQRPSISAEATYSATEEFSESISAPLEEAPASNGEQSSDSALRKDLSQLVASNPEATKDLLQQWLSDAA